MKIALISDIHANLPALSAVLADIKRRKIGVIWNLGDSVGYGPFPRETLALLMRLGLRSIRGNYDDKVLLFPRKARIWKKT
ncbi:MAG: metallophosphatase family protein [Candidatus Omnitrophica bacterium]|nr:metallophosphatase family protein [Candidatus Omnitrophota bacterium]